MPSLAEQTEEQLKGYAAQQDVISNIMMRFVESLEKMDSRFEILEKAQEHGGTDPKVLELERQIENLAFNIQGHAGKGVVEEKEASIEVSPPPSPPNRRSTSRGCAPGRWRPRAGTRASRARRSR